MTVAGAGSGRPVERSVGGRGAAAPRGGRRRCEREAKDAARAGGSSPLARGAALGRRLVWPVLSLRLRCGCAVLHATGCACSARGRPPEQRNAEQVITNGLSWAYPGPVDQLSRSVHELSLSGPVYELSRHVHELSRAYPRLIQVCPLAIQGVFTRYPSLSTSYPEPVNELSKPIHELSWPIPDLYRFVHEMSKPIHQLSKPIHQLSKPIHELS
jgi:hypothetical protein